MHFGGVQFVPRVPRRKFSGCAAISPIPVRDRLNISLSPLKSSLQKYLQTLGGLEAAAATTGTNLRDSILATAEQGMGLDWTSREPLQAAMKVSLRRTLIKLGIEASRAEQTAEKLMAWLKKNAAALTETTPAP